MDDAITPVRTEPGIREGTAWDTDGAIVARPAQETASKGTTFASRTALVLACVVGSCPVSCLLLGPASHVACGLATGEWPIGNRGDRVHPGITAAEVKALLGEPHDRRTDLHGGESWYYRTDGLGLGYLGMHIDARGFATSTRI